MVVGVRVGEGDDRGQAPEVLGEHHDTWEFLDAVTLLPGTVGRRQQQARAPSGQSLQLVVQLQVPVGLQMKDAYPEMAVHDHLGGVGCRTVKAMREAGKRVLVYDYICTAASRLGGVADCLLVEGTCGPCRNSRARSGAMAVAHRTTGRESYQALCWASP